jgi:surface polysaccharide O-acyltransferase-like enzyme
MKVEKKIITSLAFLKIYLSLLVVISHSYTPNDSIKNIIIVKLIYNMVHVPNFYILSFYFGYNLIKSKNINRIKKRFLRLLIPYFFWPIIIWSLNNILSFSIIKINVIPFEKLILQLLTGHCFMAVLWFQYNLIFITLIIIIIHLLFKDNLLYYILINLKLFGFFLQYSNYNFILFSGYEYERKYTFGRLFEIIPYCIIGYILASLKLVHILSKYRIISINIFVSIIIFNLKYNIFLEIDGFGYQGSKLFISSISLFLIFSLIPNERIDNKYLIKIIGFISIHTPGIYFIHLTVIYYLNIFSLFNNRALTDSIIIYIISFFISLFGKLIFRKTILIINK